MKARSARKRFFSVFLSFFFLVFVFTHLSSYCSTLFCIILQSYYLRKTNNKNIYISFLTSYISFSGCISEVMSKKVRRRTLLVKQFANNERLTGAAIVNASLQMPLSLKTHFPQCLGNTHGVGAIILHGRYVQDQKITGPLFRIFAERVFKWKIIIAYC